MGQYPHFNIHDIDMLFRMYFENIAMSIRYWFL